MARWSVVAVLPNLSGDRVIDGDGIALAPYSDHRVHHLRKTYPALDKFLSSFTTSFEVPLRPMTLLVTEELEPKIKGTSAVASFRDLVAMSVVPYARSNGLVYRNQHRINFSDWFWLHPWMPSANTNDKLIANTPAILGVHTVAKFHGQSSPELSPMPLDDIDEPLLDDLIVRWKRYYLSRRSRWQDTVLFRSLNMATQAAQLPAGADTTVYDLGRMSALWVSAFEILAHPRIGKSGVRKVYDLLQAVRYLDRNVGRNKFAARIRGKPSWPRRPLSCWLYGELYQARNDFLHGNPLRGKPLYPKDSKVSLFWLAPSLYRLALTGFLQISGGVELPDPADANFAAKYVAARLALQDYQGVIERALLRARR